MAINQNKSISHKALINRQAPKSAKVSQAIIAIKKRYNAERS